ncbi:MAG: PRD domain-containing protein, partial [Lachnospiraceae bacterium]|nr:PRD domain-containing protein [Lachnospiraceae bacterium]
LYAKQKISEKFNIEIPNAEVGYIAMHLIASGRNQDKRVVNKVLQVINISLNYIRENYLTDVDEDSFAYSRLVTHVKYFAHRYVGNKETTDEDALLKKTIQEAFAEEMACIEGLSGLLYDKFGRHITDSEGNYLVLHLRNCKITDM